MPLAKRRNVRARKNVIVIGIKPEGCALSMELRMNDGRQGFAMRNEPDLEDLLLDDIMAPVLRSAHVTPDDLRRQLAAALRGVSLARGRGRDD